MRYGPELEPEDRNLSFVALSRIFSHTENMFSCLLLHSTTSEPLVGEKCDVNVQVIGQVGRGKATSTYLLDRDYTDVILYVPSMIAHRDATRQHVRLTQCQVQLLGSGSGREEVETRAFELTKLDSVEYSSYMPTLPKYAALKKRYKELLTFYCSAHSCDDVLLHLGNLPAGSELKTQFEFLVRFTSTNTDSRLQYQVHNKLPTQYLSYTLNLASPLMVQDVSPSVYPGCDNAMQNFSWESLGNDDGGNYNNIIQVSYEAAFTTQDADSQLSAYSSGFVVQLIDGVSAGCCCSFSSQQALVPSSLCSSSAVHTHAANSDCDAIMMLNNTFSREQLPAHLQHEWLHPSEFVFVVDCSGSMSGTNILAAADTLITCVKSLPEGCYFNVIAFGSTFRQMFHSSEKYSKQTLEKAVAFANQLKACLGGTELLSPLRWIFKGSRCNGLPCQVFILTDGGVTNTQAVLHTVRKNRHQARCHTFGIGPEVCVELVTGIAAASGGRCVLLAEGERLQTKVMEVLKDSLQPVLMNPILRWNPPEGYTVVDTTPRNPGTLYSGTSCTAFAFLKRTDASDDNVSLQKRNPPISSGSATITGMVSGEQVEIEMGQVVLPNLTMVQNSELMSIFRQTAVWSKLCDLEMEVLTSSRKNSSHEEKLVPATKRLRLNGTVTHETQNQSTQLTDSSPREHLIDSSLQSGIPCALTYFSSESWHRSGSRMVQILPYQQNAPPPPSNKAPNHTENGIVTPQISRKRKYHSHHHCTEDSTMSSPFSIASLAKNTISSVGSTLKSVINATTFGLICPDSNPPLENGQRIDDQLEYQQNKGLQLYWDDERQEIVYPAIYYSGSLSPRPSKGKRTKSHHKNLKHTSATSMLPPLFTSSHPHQMPVCNSNGSFLPLNGVAVNGEAVVPDLEGGEDDHAISDSESDSSVDPDWDDLRRPNELLPLIHMQLYSGAWPMVRAFSFAVGVPLEEIRKLPLNKQLSAESRVNTTQEGGLPASNAVTTNEAENESKAHFWTTALAVACMEEYFTQLRPEWELIAYKGQTWLQQNVHRTDLSMEDVQRISKELVLRQS